MSRTPWGMLRKRLPNPAHEAERQQLLALAREYGPASFNIMPHLPEKVQAKLKVVSTEHRALFFDTLKEVAAREDRDKKYDEARIRRAQERRARRNARDVAHHTNPDEVADAENSGLE